MFVEKPLAITGEELSAVEAAYERAHTAGPGPLLMVGFNRRFSPLVVRMSELLRGVPEPKSFILTMNAGALPADHWTQDPAVGGGRIIGEACHHIDLMRLLAGSAIVSVPARGLGRNPAVPVSRGQGHHRAGLRRRLLRLAPLPGQRRQGLRQGAGGGLRGRPHPAVGQLPHPQRLRLDGLQGQRLRKPGQGPGGLRGGVRGGRSQGGPAPIPYEEIMEVARVSIEVAEQLRG